MLGYLDTWIILGDGWEEISKIFVRMARGMFTRKKIEISKIEGLEHGKIGCSLIGTMGKGLSTNSKNDHTNDQWI